MPLSAYYAGRELIGEPDARELPITADLYLLDDTYTIRSARVREGDTGLGEDFFRRFPTAREEREALSQYLAGYDRAHLLIQGVDTPVLFIGTFFRQTGLVLAALPHGEVKRALTRPALYDRIPETLRISRGGLAKYAVPTQAEREAVARWYGAVSKPFSCDVTHGTQGVLHTLSARAAYLAALCGCRLEFDLTGLGLRPGDALDVELYTGVLLATLMAAGRMTAERTVRMRVQRDYGIGAVMYAELWRDAEDPLGELASPEARAATRGAILDVYCLPDDPRRVEVRASLSHVELSLQEGKERHLLLHGRSVLELSPQEILFDDEI